MPEGRFNAHTRQRLPAGNGLGMGAWGESPSASPASILGILLQRRKEGQGRAPWNVSCGFSLHSPCGAPELSLDWTWPWVRQT